MKPITIALLITLFFNTIDLQAQDGSRFFSASDSFLKTFTANGKVDYKGIIEAPEMLHEALDIAAKLNIKPKDGELYKAFWINAYNLTVIKGVIDNYPIKSPLDVKGFFDTIRYNVGGKSLTLNEIENKMLRAQFDEPRFHFVLVCGALGCPPIRSEVYLPQVLEDQLQEQTVKALNDNNFIRVSKGEVLLSEIFKWYQADFIKDGNGELRFINKYRRNKIPLDSRISYYTYNWLLNLK